LRRELEIVSAGEEVWRINGEESIPGHSTEPQMSSPTLCRRSCPTRQASQYLSQHLLFQFWGNSGLPQESVEVYLYGTVI